MSRKTLAQLLILSFGIILVLSSLFIPKPSCGNSITLNTVLLSIGCSIISVVIINYIEYLITLPERETIKNVNSWGLKSIYKTRAKMNDDTNKLLEKAKELDIAVYGAKNFLNFQGVLLKERLKKKMIMRILIPIKDSCYISQREKDENATAGEITKTISDLCKWVSLVKNELKLSDDFLMIKQYNCLPIESIMRIDEDLFVGPFMVKKPSQQTMAYRYHHGGTGYDYYLDYFNEIWDDPDISSVVNSGS
jgi:hypothetical protein